MAKRKRAPHKFDGGEGFYVVLLFSLTQKPQKFSPFFSPAFDI